MAEFKEELVITALHPEKAEVGKKYFFADKFSQLKSRVEDGEKVDILKSLANEGCPCPFVSNDNCMWELMYPYEEPPKQRMSNLQLAEWLAKGNGLFKYKNATAYCYAFATPLESELNDEVAENIVIRTWDSEEWVEPTVDIYERDCKGKENV